VFVQQQLLVVSAECKLKLTWKSKPWTWRLKSARKAGYPCYPWLSYCIDLVIIFCCLFVFASDLCPAGDIRRVSSETCVLLNTWYNFTPWALRRIRFWDFIKDALLDVLRWFELPCRVLPSAQIHDFWAASCAACSSKKVTSWATLERIHNILGLWFPFWDVLICVSACFPCYVQHFGAEAAISTVFATFWSWNLSIFHRICNMLVEFVTFWSWKLPFQRYLQYFWVRTFHFRWNLQHVVARTVHVTWLFATRVHLGLVLGLVYGFCLVLSF